MLKKACIFLSLLLTIFCYGQKSTLLENVNYRAKELKQSLSINGDSLILEGERRIYSVEIFNQNFEKTIQVEGNQTKIPLNDTPLGRLVVQAKLIDKRILITLLRHEQIDDISKKLKTSILNNSLVSKPIAKALTVENEIVFSGYIKPPVPTYKIKDTEIIIIDSTTIRNRLVKSDVNSKKTIYVDRHAQLLSGRQKKATHKINTYYWVKYEINNGSTSRKSMRLVNKESADKLILKHKLEIKTLKGRLNELTIWEVYDKRAFIEKQVSNPNYINALSSDFFNVSPYFSSENNIK
ncbi:hypothetical protein [Winogradskyella sp.]|uniref:hypothetical protein n=1 Tax=Winogradskyella sp. TaxID=1883156 RepID=UPI0025D0725A|nr:hypothetical protein [Winogradskyella sp.]